MIQTLKYFQEITAYPRPSKQEEKIREFLIDFFSNKWFEYKVDKTGNLIVYVPAKNSDSKETVILQSHMDMVCVKTADSNHDFMTDAIQTYEKDWYMYALNTTLWADNGIWVAYAMATIDFPSHPKLELLFTIDEEAWMSGVLWLDFSLLSGTKIINIDSEDEDEICISSAGWMSFMCNKELNFINWKYPQYTLDLFGMKWWHSGVEIHKNRWNVTLVMLNFLAKYDKDLEICDIKAWVASNVIPSKLNCILWISDLEDFKKEFLLHLENTKSTFDCPEIDFKLTENDEKRKAIENGIEILKNLSQIKDWVYSMSEQIENLVQTSMNFWIIKVNDNNLEITYMARSSDNQDLEKNFTNTSEFLKSKWFEISASRWTPGWQDNPNSLLVQIAKEEWEKILWKTPHIRAIHAWLECWALVSWLNNPQVNAISIGPNIQFVHSTEERVELESVKKVEKILEWILARI